MDPLTSLFIEEHETRAVRSVVLHKQEVELSLYPRSSDGPESETFGDEPSRSPTLAKSRKPRRGDGRASRESLL